MTRKRSRSIEYFELDPDAIRASLAGPSQESKLYRLADRFKRLFRLRSPFAPGLAFIGGEVDPGLVSSGFAGHGLVSVAGNGPSVPVALASCIGEGIEFLSQFERPGDVVASATAAELETSTTQSVRDWCRLHADQAQGGAGPKLDWVSAICLGNRTPVLLPADLSLRRLPEVRKLYPRSALSTGCAAGASREAATLRALLELIERDAASLWWVGGRRPRPVCLENPAIRSASELLAALREGQQMRRAWLIDITTEFEIPCLAALSVEADGRGLACGLAARMTPEQAAHSAILEMCQMELALAVVETKQQERGEAALNTIDRRHAERGRMLSAEDCALLHPAGAPVLAMEPELASIADQLAAVVERLAGSGIETYAVDLTRKEFGVAVIRAVAPGLQLLPSELIGARLAQTIIETGGGHPHTKSISLL